MPERLASTSASRARSEPISPSGKPRGRPGPPSAPRHLTRRRPRVDAAASRGPPTNAGRDRTVPAVGCSSARPARASTPRARCWLPYIINNDNFLQ
jgi:hypothetical protein